jgi:DNA-binding HxlR family transcriptional regulator
MGMLPVMARVGYGQFCPVAKTAELLAERWMPLVVRELLAGSCHFGDLRRGIPLISPATLSQRLHELVDAGILEQSRAGHPSRCVQYRLTEAGEQLRPIIRAFGVWGQRWAQHDLRPGEMDPELLTWAMHRRLHLAELPADHAVLLFEFPDVEIRLRRFWFVIDHRQVDVCLKNPGHDVDLTIATSIRTMTMVYLGQLQPDAAVRSGAIDLDGSRPLARTFSAWCPTSPFAAAARHPAGVQTAPSSCHDEKRAAAVRRPRSGPSEGSSKSFAPAARR